MQTFPTAEISCNGLLDPASRAVAWILRRHDVVSCCPAGLLRGRRRCCVLAAPAAAYAAPHSAIPVGALAVSTGCMQTLKPRTRCRCRRPHLTVAGCNVSSASNCQKCPMSGGLCGSRDCCTAALQPLYSATQLALSESLPCWARLQLHTMHAKIQRMPALFTPSTPLNLPLSALTRLKSNVIFFVLHRHLWELQSLRKPPKPSRVHLRAIGRSHHVRPGATAAHPKDRPMHNVAAPLHC